MVVEIQSEQARWHCPLDFLDGRSTAELQPLEGIIGQGRTVKALQFGLKMKRRGFNIFIAGQPGTGRKTATTNFLEEVSKTMPVPSDWCYVARARRSMHVWLAQFTSIRKPS